MYVQLYPRVLVTACNNSTFSVIDRKKSIRRHRKQLIKHLLKS